MRKTVFSSNNSQNVFLKSNTLVTIDLLTVDLLSTSTTVEKKSTLARERMSSIHAENTILNSSA